MKGNTGDIIGVSFEGHDGIRVAGLDVVEAHHVAAGSSEELLVWSDA